MSTQKIGCIQYDAPEFVCEGESWMPKVGLKASCRFSNTLLIAIDTVDEAEEAIAAGKKILWDAAFDMTLSLAEAQEQLQRLCSLLEDRWSCHTAGINLWSGTLEDLTVKQWTWLPEDHFERWHEATELLPSPYTRSQYGVDLLEAWTQEVTAGLADYLYFVCIDARSCEDTLAFYQLSRGLRNERLHSFWRPPHPDCVVNLAWKEGVAMEGYLGENPLPLLPKSSTALLLPPVTYKGEAAWEALRPIIEDLHTKALPYRTIAEERLSLVWQGIDTIHVASDAVTPLGRRQLEGFAAAGGIVVAV